MPTITVDDKRAHAVARPLGRSLALLEGRQVSIVLHDGSRIDDCQLVSAGRSRVAKVWLFANGHDAFIPRDGIADVWETPATPSHAA
jgi:hypothetical protein